MIPKIVLEETVRRALMEDLQGGDLTTEATVAEDARAVAHARAKSDLVVCGADVFASVFLTLDPGLRVVHFHEDGARVPAGTELFRVEGSTRSILLGERTALNFVQRMSGIATQARQYVDALPPGCPTRITDTRKTTPGLRALERYAVRCGGAHNHRDALGAGILIKDNHIEAAGGVVAALECARRRAPHTVRLEIEVDSVAALELALRARADIVMLDNFAPDDLASALGMCRGKALVEVSGGITLERIGELGRLGVDVVSVGALTHSVPAADIALSIERIGPDPA